MRIFRYVGSFLVGAVLIAPAGMAGTNFQDDHHQDDKHRDRDDKNQKRYYDRNHKDYHNWDDAKIVRISNGPPKITATIATSPISSGRNSQNTGTGVTITRMMIVTVTSLELNLATPLHVGQIAFR
jgi:hypothetical protein